MNTKELNTPSINKTVHELYCEWNKETDTRLKKYIAEVEPTLNFNEAKRYFMKGEPGSNWNLTPAEELDNYFKNANEFLIQNGY